MHIRWYFHVVAVAALFGAWIAFMVSDDARSVLVVVCVVVFLLAEFAEVAKGVWWILSSLWKWLLSESPPRDSEEEQ